MTAIELEMAKHKLEIVKTIAPSFIPVFDKCKRELLEQGKTEDEAIEEIYVSMKSAFGI